MTVKAPGSKRGDLEVMKLRMVRNVLDPETGEKGTDVLIVFYWYASVEHLTASNMRRIALTAWDRMILGKNYRWSYVLCTSPVSGNDPDAEQRVMKGLYTFTQQFFPAVEK